MNGRDRTVDALRAVAVLGVVLGHWLVTAVVANPYRISEVHGESPLSYAHWLTPFSWLLQALGLFFFASGYATAKNLARPPTWQLIRPVLPLALVWIPALFLLTLAGAPDSTRHLVESLVTQPLWFLLAYLVLTSLGPLLVKVGPWLVLPAVAFVAIADASRGLPTWSVLVTAPVGWSVPYLLGIALAQNRLRRSAGRILVRPELAQILNHSFAWLPVALLNRAAMTIFVWHQTALLLVTFAGLLAGRPAGLLDTPDGAWLLDRLRWLPVFALVLVVLVAIFHRFEADSGPQRPQRSKMSYGAGTMVESGADHQWREEGRT